MLETTAFQMAFSINNLLVAQGAVERVRIGLTHPVYFSVFFFIIAIIACAGIILLRKPEHRETVRRGVAHLGRHTATLCHSLRLRRRSDDQSNLLGNRVTVPAFGSIHDDDDDVDMILA